MHEATQDYTSSESNESDERPFDQIGMLHQHVLYNCIQKLLLSLSKNILMTIYMHKW